MTHKVKPWTYYNKRPLSYAGGRSAGFQTQSASAIVLYLLHHFCWGRTSWGQTCRCPVINLWAELILHLATGVKSVRCVDGLSLWISSNSLFCFITRGRRVAMSHCKRRSINRSCCCRAWVKRVLLLFTSMRVLLYFCHSGYFLISGVISLSLFPRPKLIC